MNSRDYYKVSYGNRNESKVTAMGRREVLDNETEFNANQFKLFDDFTTDLRISYNPMRNNYHEIIRTDGRRRVGDPNDSGVDMENGNPHDDVTMSNDAELLENEVMVDPWSSMDSSNSPLTDSGPSASEDCTPSTSSEPPRGPLEASSPLSPDALRVPNQKDAKSTKYVLPKTDRARSRDLTLELESDPFSRRPHFLDDDFQSSSKTNIECRIPKPHFLDHSPSPDEFDERSDITNPNFLDDEVDGDEGQAQKKAGALPKKPQKPSSSTYFPHEDRPHRTNYRTSLHYGLESAARSSERDKRTSQLYRGTWPGERDVWTGHDSSSVRSFSSNGSADGGRPSSNLENKMECVCSLISLLSLSPENNADLSGPLLDMSRSVESCIAMRQAGCIPLLVQLIHSKVPRETRDRAAKALRNIIHTQTDDKAGRREARVWRLLEQVREYCYVLEDLVEARKDGKEIVEDDATKHPSQSVAALMKLSFDEEHRHVVCQLGGLQALAALVSGDQAAHGSRTDDNTCLTMRKYAGMTLTNLTFGDGNNKSLLCSFKDFMLALVEQLESPNDDMRQVTAAVLRNLSWRADTNSKLVLREVGAVKGLTKAAMTCQKEATLKSVLSALWNLTAHCSMNKVALCSVDGALGFLVDMLSYNSPTKTLAIVENAGGIMRNVSSHIAVREDYRQILRERSCLSVLLQHLKSPSLTVVSNSCGTLWNLSARCPQDQQYLWDHGAVPMLRSLIHSKHKMIAMGSGAALKNLLNSKPGKTHIISLDTTARSMNLPALPTLGARKQKALEQELDQNLAETCDNIEPATSPSTSNREEKNLFTATERQIAMNLERHRMTSSSPLMGTLTSQISLSHSAHLASYLSCSNTLLKGALVSRPAGGSAGNVNRSDSKDSVTSTHSDSVFERAMRTGKVPVPTPRNRDLMKSETGGEAFKTSKRMSKDGTFLRYPMQPPIPPPRTTELRTNYTESGFDVDQDSCDQPIDYSRKYSETKTTDAEIEKPKAETKKYVKKDSGGTYGDYQETDLDQPTDYSLRYAEHQSETGSDSEPPGPSVHEDTIKHFATEGTPYETPIIFSTATSMSDLRVIGKEGKAKAVSSVKENPEVMTHSDEKDTCSIEDPPRHDNDLAATTPQSTSGTEQTTEKRGVFDTKFSSGMVSPEKPVNYCDEGTPGYFSRVSSLSSLGEPTEEDSLAKRNAMATINVNPGPADRSTGIAKDKEGSKAVTFATEPVSCIPVPEQQSGRDSGSHTPARYVEETPLMFSRSSSLGSVPECDHQDDQGSVLSELSRLTSGCISPSEIPDSPGAPASPPVPLVASSPPQESSSSTCSERVARFAVEHTPAHFSCATSLSSLTIGSEPALDKDLVQKLPRVQRDSSDAPNSTELENAQKIENRSSMRPVGISTQMRREPAKESQTPTEVCCVYFTEDTPAILSKAGSNSDLSALSIECGGHTPHTPRDPPHDTHDTSDSSNLSDAGDLLEECIQKGIAKVVKNKGPSETSANNHGRDDLYRSLPPYLRCSTETVRLSRKLPASPPSTTGLAATVHIRDSGGSVSGSGSGRSSPAPPLPPKPAPPAPAPGAPPRLYARVGEGHEGRQHESRLPVKNQRAPPALPRADSLSSLSVDSFGSTDRELFEETVKAGLFSVNPRARYTLQSKGKAHSVERPPESTRHGRHHRSLDRSDDVRDSKADRRPKVRDPEFERNLASGAYELKSSGKMKNLEVVNFDRGQFGDRSRLRNARQYSEGPASLPARIDDRRRPLERSNSLTSLSNDSFGSTDKEVFERCVKMGMSKPQPKRREDKIRVRSDDRSEARDHRRRRREAKGALDKMVGEDAKDRALLEEVIARGAGEHKPSKNVPEPSAEAAPAGELAHTARIDTGSEALLPDAFPANELPAVQSANTTLDSTDDTEMERSNECLAPESANTTIESEKDELNRSNESYADVLDGSWSDSDSPKNYEAATLTPKNGNRLEWTDIKYTDRPPEDASRKEDTWNDNTCPDDVTFPTISGSVHMVSSIRSEVLDPGVALPDLLEKSEAHAMSFSRPDLTDKLEVDILFSQNLEIVESTDRIMLESVPEPSFASLLDEQKFDSLLAAEIEQEAARLAAQLKTSQFNMETSVTSVASLDLEHVKPPSNLGSLLSLSASAHWEDNSQTSKKSQRNRKKSLPVASMVKRALGNSMQHGSSEHLDSAPHSFLENVKPPSDMERIDMEGSMVSVSSIVSEVADSKDRAPVVFDFREPIRDFPLCHAFPHVFHDLDKVNPPSLFDEMAESTLEIEQTTAQLVFGESNTLNIVTDIFSGSENCTPLPSDASSVEATPKKRRDPKYLTAKEKRHASKDRYQTYTITDTVTESDVVLEVDEEFLTWTKSDSGRSDDRVPLVSEPKSRRRVSAKQRRLEDRARYQTQTVDIDTVMSEAIASEPDPSIESLKRRLAAKKSVKQRRVEEAERFRTRTLSEDIPPSPTYVTKDANLENAETTTGYDSLSSNDASHQALPEPLRSGGDSGHNDNDDPPGCLSGVDLCLFNNLKNIRLTASYRRCDNNPSSGEFASYDGSNEDERPRSDSGADSTRAKPKIVKPTRRDDSLDSNDSLEVEEAPKAIRGRKKATYVSPYRRAAPAPKNGAASAAKPAPKSAPAVSKPSAIFKAPTVPRALSKSQLASKAVSANTSPKKSAPNRSPINTAQQKAAAVPPVASKPLPLERQGTFTKEESSVPARDLPVPDKTAVTPRLTKSAPQTKANTSPSRLPQLHRYGRPPATRAPVRSPTKTANKSPTKSVRQPETSMKNSPSDHSLQSNESGKTITIASRSSRQGSTSSVNSVRSTSRPSAKDVESKIASLWKRVERAKAQPAKDDDRVWIGSDETEQPRLIRSSTFEGQPNQSKVPPATKQKSAIGIRVSQIPSLRPKPVPSKAGPAAAKRPASSRVLARRPLGPQLPT